MATKRFKIRIPNIPEVWNDELGKEQRAWLKVQHPADYKYLLHLEKQQDAEPTGAGASTTPTTSKPKSKPASKPTSKTKKAVAPKPTQPTQPAPVSESNAEAKEEVAP